jgi:hypothetical protein
MWTYLLLHLLFGLVAGGTLRYLRRPGGDSSKGRSWLAYVIGGGLCLALAAAIGQFPRHETVEESWRLWGVVVLAATFLSVGFVGRRT